MDGGLPRWSLWILLAATLVIAFHFTRVLGLLH
jgi:hypothetical protein